MATLLLVAHHRGVCALHIWYLLSACCMVIYCGKRSFVMVKIEGLGSVLLSFFFDH